MAEPENSFVFTKVQQVPAFCHLWYLQALGFMLRLEFILVMFGKTGSWGATAVKGSLCFSLSFIREGNDCSLVNCRKLAPFFFIYYVYFKRLFACERVLLIRTIANVNYYCWAVRMCVSVLSGFNRV